MQNQGSDNIENIYISSQHSKLIGSRGHTNIESVCWLHNFLTNTPRTNTFLYWFCGVECKKRYNCKTWPLATSLTQICAPLGDIKTTPDPIDLECPWLIYPIAATSDTLAYPVKSQTQHNLYKMSWYVWKTSVNVNQVSHFLQYDWMFT